MPGTGRWSGEGALVSPHLSIPSLAVLLDPPAGLLARLADEGGHVLLRWLPPPGAPMASLIRYEVNISAGNAAGGAQRVRPAATAQLPKGSRVAIPAPPI